MKDLAVSEAAPNMQRAEQAEKSSEYPMRWRADASWLTTIRGALGSKSLTLLTPMANIA